MGCSNFQETRSPDNHAMRRPQMVTTQRPGRPIQQSPRNEYASRQGLPSEPFHYIGGYSTVLPVQPMHNITHGPTQLQSSNVNVTPLAVQLSQIPHQRSIEPQSNRGNGTALPQQSIRAITPRPIQPQRDLGEGSRKPNRQLSTLSQEEREAEKRQKTLANIERRKNKQARVEAAKLAERSEIERQAKIRHNWNQQKVREAKRTRTYPYTNAIPFPGPENMRERSEDDNMYYSLPHRTDFTNDEARGVYQHQNRTITKADVVRDLAGAPPPLPLKIDGYPHVYHDHDQLLPPQVPGSYVEWPVTGKEHIPHTKGQNFNWTHTHGRKTGPFRAVTDVNKNFIGIVGHNHPDDVRPAGFQKARENYLGPPPSVPRPVPSPRRNTGS